MDISSLGAAQLSNLQARLSQEIEHLSTSHTRLRSAQQRFRECIHSIEGGVRAQKDGKNCFLLTLACINISGRRLGWGRQGGEGGEGKC